MVSPLCQGYNSRHFTPRSEPTPAALLRQISPTIFFVLVCCVCRLVPRRFLLMHAASFYSYLNDCMFAVSALRTIIVHINDSIYYKSRSKPVVYKFSHSFPISSFRMVAPNFFIHHPKKQKRSISHFRPTRSVAIRFHSMPIHAFTSGAGGEESSNTCHTPLPVFPSLSVCCELLCVCFVILQHLVVYQVFDVCGDAQFSGPGTPSY